MMAQFGLNPAGGVSSTLGDADGDLDVDGEDFLAWQTQDGETPPSLESLDAMVDAAITSAASSAPSRAPRRCGRSGPGCPWRIADDKSRNSAGISRFPPEPPFAIGLARLRLVVVEARRSARRVWPAD